VKGGLGREGVKHVGLHTNHGWMLVIFHSSSSMVDGGDFHSSSSMVDGGDFLS
jgi:hypothetical protein